MANPPGFDDLPLDCLANIFSFLPPLELRRAALLSRRCSEAVRFDTAWRRVLPQTYEQLMALNPQIGAIELRSLRDIYFRLGERCWFFEHDSKYFRLDIDTGRLILSTGARGLDITWGNDFRYWAYQNTANSVYQEVAYLKNVCWFEVRGEIRFSLPPGAYTLTWRLFHGQLVNWDSEPLIFSVDRNDMQFINRRCYIVDRPEHRRDLQGHREPMIRRASDGWVEYDVAEFDVEEDEDSAVLRFGMRATDRGLWKSGLSVDGVFIRPKTQ